MKLQEHWGLESTKMKNKEFQNSVYILQRLITEYLYSRFRRNGEWRFIQKDILNKAKQLLKQEEKGNEIKN